MDPLSTYKDKYIKYTNNNKRNQVGVAIFD